MRADDRVAAEQARFIAARIELSAVDSKRVAQLTMVYLSLIHI